VHRACTTHASSSPRHLASRGGPSANMSALADTHDCAQVDTPHIAHQSMPTVLSSRGRAVELDGLTAACLLADTRRRTALRTRWQEGRAHPRPERQTGLWQSARGPLRPRPRRRRRPIRRRRRRRHRRRRRRRRRRGLRCHHCRLCLAPGPASLPAPPHPLLPLRALKDARPPQ